MTFRVPVSFQEPVQVAGQQPVRVNYRYVEIDTDISTELHIPPGEFWRTITAQFVGINSGAATEDCYVVIADGSNNKTLYQKRIDVPATGVFEFTPLVPGQDIEMGPWPGGVIYFICVPNTNTSCNFNMLVEVTS